MSQEGVKHHRQSNPHYYFTKQKKYNFFIHPHILTLLAFLPILCQLKKMENNYHLQTYTKSKTLYKIKQALF